jgi:caffeoyl-CoA O-methyltransferase
MLCDAMLSLLAPELAAYVDSHSAPESELLQALRQRTQAELVDPQMQVGRVEGALLRLLVRISGARRVIEVGTFSGYSTLCLAEGLPEDGHVVTCDIDPVATAVAREFFDRSPHGRKIDLRLGPALATLSTLASTGRRFDLAFIDADKTGYAGYLEEILPRLRRGGVILVDNVLWGGAVVDAARQDADTRAIRAFNDAVARDPRVDAVMLPLSDGVTLLRKR